jgi:hypothetical protein
MLSRPHRAARLPLPWLAVIFLALVVPAQAGDPLPEHPKKIPKLQGRALILAGLPGDKEHEERFAQTVQEWRKWLTGPMGFDPAEIRVLFGKGGKDGAVNGPATRETIEKEAARLKQSLRPEDRCWVFFLGHANFDGEHAWFHLPGPDLREDRLGKLFAGIKCREQIFWMTTSESGRFLPGLSAKGRIVIAATRSSNEDNETEFPQALIAVANRPLDALDLTKDGKVSLLELYYLILAEVQSRYASDNRVPTEHAQLDDNGDRAGTERPLAASKDDSKPAPDGIFAFATILPYQPPPPEVKTEKPPSPGEKFPKQSSNNESVHGKNERL